MPLARPPSPSPSASGSIGPFTFDSSANSVSSTLRAAPRANFWDFEAYSRSFLHEKKLIEREKEEWERKVEDRRVILKKSTDFYLDKYKELRDRSELCLKKYQKLIEASEVVEIESEILLEGEKVEKLKLLVKYFQAIQTILKEEQKDDKFKEGLLRQNWKESLDNLAKIINNLDSCGLKNIEILKNSLIEKRLNLFNSILGKKIKTYIDGLGWPKIVSNDETVEIISRLQELLTYGEALYILGGTAGGGVSSASGIQIQHPLKYFIDPIKVRFDYHFNSDKPTNQLNRPEWYFDHLIALTRETINFMREFIFPCWRLRDLDNFLRDGIINLAEERTRNRLILIETSSQSSAAVADEQQELIIHYLIEFGKFLKCIQDEFGYLCADEEGIIEDVFITADPEGFISRELERIQTEFKADNLFTEEDSWSPAATGDDPQMGEPSPIVLKFLSFFHAKTVLPYSFIHKNMKIRAELLVRVQTWLLESFHDKCQFECSPLHNDKESILKDIGMINSMMTVCKVLQDDFGESLDYVELSSSKELIDLIGYDASILPGTCFNRAIEAFKLISDRLSSYVFNYVMDRFLKPATSHSNSMIYARIQDDHRAPLSENLRLAIANVIESVNFIRPFLHEMQFKKLFLKLLPEKIAAFMFQGVLLKNFYTEAGAERFCQDLQYIQDTLSEIIDPEVLKGTFAKVSEAAQILKIKEKDAKAPFDGQRLQRAVKEHRVEELKRFLELMRWTCLGVEDLEEIFASRRH